MHGTGGGKIPVSSGTGGAAGWRRPPGELEGGGEGRRPPGGCQGWRKCRRRHLELRWRGVKGPGAREGRVGRGRRSPAGFDCTRAQRLMDAKNRLVTASPKDVQTSIKTS